MNRHVQLLSTFVWVLLASGCSFVAGDTVPSHDDWTQACQQQFDLDRGAKRTSTGAYVVAVVKSIGACATGDDLDKTVAASDYPVSASPVSDARARLDGAVRPRLMTDGWAFRDRTDEPNQVDGTTLDCYWGKGDANFVVTVSSDGDGQPARPAPRFVVVRQARRHPA
jgi:hypothetical protein